MGANEAASDLACDDLEAMLKPLWHPELDPLFWPAARAGVASAWTTHVPFAHWLVAALRPRVIVELGTYNGVSYAAFCEAVQRARLDCRCFAVDTWEGDDHAGFYDGAVHAELKKFHDDRYAAFSHLLRCTFDAALDRIPDASVDLLHIDGRHFFDSVKHDYVSWLPKLSERAVVLFHDTMVREREFGVWRLWAELRALHPSFEFTHGHGLGVLAVGGERALKIRALTGLSEDRAAIVGERFARLGEIWQGVMQVNILSREAADRSAEQARQVASSAAAEESARMAAAEAVGRLQQLKRDLAAAEHARARAETAVADLTARHAELVSSTAWRATWPLRRLGEVMPDGLRRAMRFVVCRFNATR